MQKRQLGRNGLEVSALSLGCMGYGEARLEPLIASIAGRSAPTGSVKAPSRERPTMARMRRQPTFATRASSGNRR